MTDEKTRVTRPLPSVPGYELIGFLGEGGMAQVFLAEDLGLKRQVALKMISTPLSRMADFRTRFETEGRTVAGFRHPNIVTVFASGICGDRRYIVMEYVAGGTLSQRLDAGPLTQHTAVTVAATMADALAYSHARGVIHRDFKPGNILFTGDAQPVLSDFGVAKTTGEGGAETVAGTIMGAPRYMAPEQALGREVTDRADVYAWGLVFFEMLTGQLPDAGDAVIRDRTQAEKLIARFPRSQRRCADLIVRCLDVDPGARPSARTCADIVAGAGGNPAPYRAGRRRALAAAAGMLVSGAAALGIFALLWPGDPAPPVPVEPAPITTPAKPPTADVGSSAEPVAPAEAADPSWMLALPEGGRAYLDGQPLTAIDGVRANQGRELALVAGGYNGRLVDLTRTAPGTLNMTPISLPDAREHRAFVSQYFGSGPPTPAVPVTTAPLTDLLALRRMPPEARAPARHRLTTLARVGDHGAILALYLAAEQKLIDADVHQRVIALTAASDAGYALASFYLALHLKDAAGLEMAESSADYRRFMELLALAEYQGLDSAIVDPVRSNVTRATPEAARTNEPAGLNSDPSTRDSTAAWEGAR